MTDDEIEEMVRQLIEDNLDEETPSAESGAFLLKH